MSHKKILIIAAVLILGAIVNYAWAVVAKMYAIPVGAEFVIAAYCLLIVLLPFSWREALCIGIAAGVLTILANPNHAIAIESGQLVMKSGYVLGLANVVSELVGVLACFFVFAYLAVRFRTTAPFVATFIATLASSLAYVVLVSTFNPSLHVTDPAWLGDFLVKVGQVALTDAVVVQVLFLLLHDRVQACRATAAVP
ncbi:hypothetical protein [Methanoregula formicica]|uniref:Uncharacterized protein n=1 Tax=Methanoregula formicica (strain DSM 22288 / NBRC 105244 / SMSP) TaxID=593750 RepID=L0HDZ6_METFS|nr:hypothetical protein [Methanoregula formicica]AGB01548.1 hypothetical protein Metfor_0476 [Methanoregula formicica SMSP]